MLINVGCGGHHAPAPWVNVDAYPGANPDVIADAGDLPFDDGTVEALYCGHLLEHLDETTELPAVLAEFRRVLAPWGQLCVVGPDYDRAAGNPEWSMLLSVIVSGGCRYPGDAHKWTATGPLTLAHVRTVFPDAWETDIVTLTGWPVVDHVGWQFAVLA